MDNKPQGLNRSRRRSVSTSNPTILSLTAFEQIFDSATVSPLQARTPRDLQPASQLEVAENEKSAQAEQFNSQMVDVCFEDDDYQATTPTLQPYFPRERVTIQLGTQTVRVHINSTACQTQMNSLQYAKQAANLQAREAQLIDIQDRVAIELQELRAARAKLDADKAALLREQTKLRVAERELRGRQQLVDSQTGELKRMRVEMALTKLKLVNRRGTETKRWAWGLIVQSRNSLQFTLSAKIGRTVLTEFNNRSTHSPTSTPKARHLQSRPLDFSFKDDRPEMVIPPLPIHNHTRKRSIIEQKRLTLDDKRPVIDEQAMRQSKERCFHKDVREVKDTKECKGASRKGMNYPLNYKR